MPAKNAVVHQVGDQLKRKLTQPAAGGLAGDPGLVGDRPCVLLGNQDAAGRAVVKFSGTVRVTVHGFGASAAAAIAESGAVYYDAGSGADPRINGDLTNGVRFGTVAEAVASGAKVDVLVDIHR